MTVSHKPYIIFEIEGIRKAEGKYKNRIFMSRPELDMYRITAILKSYIEKTQEGLNILDKLGLGEKLTQLNMEYLNNAEAFTVTIPVTHQTINWNKYHVGGEIMIAYYPTNVWATFHTEGEADNNDEQKTNVKTGKKKKEDVE